MECRNLPTKCILCLLYGIVLLQKVTNCCSIHMGVFILYIHIVLHVHKYPVLNSGLNLSIKPHRLQDCMFFVLFNIVWLRFAIIIHISWSPAGVWQNENTSHSFSPEHHHLTSPAQTNGLSQRHEDGVWRCFLIYSPLLSHRSPWIPSIENNIIISFLKKNTFTKYHIYSQ